MPTIEEARNALDLHNLELPKEPEIDELQVREYVDADGDDALYVQVILSEGVDAASISGEKIMDIKDKIRARLNSLGFRLFCYISFVKASELHPH